MPNDNIIVKRGNKSPFAQDVNSVLQNWNFVRTYYTRQLRRCIENWRFYWALDPELGLGQWPEQSVNYMLSQNRQILSYNFVMPIVDTIAGALVQNQFDPEIYPVNEEMTSLTMAIKKAMYSDKELMNWDTPYLEVVRGGLIFEHCMKMVIGDRYNKEQGNIGFQSCLPGSVYKDPMWKSLNGWDLKHCWEETWHMPEDILNLYPDVKDILINEIMMNEGTGRQYGSFDGPTPWLQDTHQWGSAKRLIHQYDIHQETVSHDYAITPAGKVRIPDDIEIDARISWLNRMHPGWSPEHLFTEK
jgi:hypothetical protein